MVFFFATNSFIHDQPFLHTRMHNSYLFIHWLFWGLWPLDRISKCASTPAAVSTKANRKKNQQQKCYVVISIVTNFFFNLIGHTHTDTDSDNV